MSYEILNAYFREERRSNRGLSVSSFCTCNFQLPRAVNTQTLSGAGFLKMINRASDAVNKMTIKMNESDTVSGYRMDSLAGSSELGSVGVSGSGSAPRRWWMFVSPLSGLRTSCRRLKLRSSSWGSFILWWTPSSIIGKVSEFSSVFHSNSFIL